MIEKINTKSFIDITMIIIDNDITMIKLKMLCSLLCIYINVLNRKEKLITHTLRINFEITLKRQSCNS